MELLLLLALAVGAYYVYVRNVRGKPKLSNLAKDNSESLRTYSEEMGKFKDTTLNYVVSEFSPLKELPEAIVISLATYLVEASSAACSHAGVDNSLRSFVDIKLLTEMGFPEDYAKGMLHAISTKPSKLDNDLTFGLGVSGFNAWIRSGDTAAQDHIREAMTVWYKLQNLSDEIDAAAK